MSEDSIAPYPRGVLANARRLWLHYKALAEAGQPADAATVARDLEPVVRALERACDEIDALGARMAGHANWLKRSAEVRERVTRIGATIAAETQQRRSGLYWVTDPQDPLHPTPARWDAERGAWWLLGAEAPYPGDLEPLDSLTPPPHVLPQRSVADVIADADAEAAGEALDWPLVGHGYRDRDTGAEYVVADIEPIGGALTDAHRSGGRLHDDPGAWMVRGRYAG